MLGLVVWTGAVAWTACHRTHHDRDDDDPQTDEGGEDQDVTRPNFWRVEVQIRGRGAVSGTLARLACTSDGRQQQGACGPVLLKFDELHPPLVRAVAGPGARFDHWEPTIREPDGTTRARRGPVPDGSLYLDGFGYRDTGELEVLTAVFTSEGRTR